MAIRPASPSDCSTSWNGFSILDSIGPSIDEGVKVHSKCCLKTTLERDGNKELRCSAWIGHSRDVNLRGPRFVWELRTWTLCFKSNRILNNSMRIIIKHRGKIVANWVWDKPGSPSGSRIYNARVHNAKPEKVYRDSFKPQPSHQTSPAVGVSAVNSSVIRTTYLVSWHHPSALGNELGSLLVDRLLGSGNLVL